MADEKKMVPEPEKPNMTAASEQLIMDKGDSPGHEKVTPTKAEVDTQKPLVENKAPIAPKKKEPEKPKEQNPIIPGKVVDFSTAQKTAEKPKVTEKRRLRKHRAKK